ncbi:MAG: NtrZ family periplasmic regulatory protein [Pseudomonadota bacterium]
MQKSVVGLAAVAALLSAPVAFAQDSAGFSATQSQSAETNIQLRGVSLAGDMAETLANAGFISLPEPGAQTDVVDQAERSHASSGLRPLTPTEDSGSASALPWYERFTEAQPQRLNSAWGGQAAEFSFSAGERWGFTLGFADSVRGPQFELEDVSAGAFFRLNDRFRLGGELRFTSPEEDVFGEAGEERGPELKFESAFRF